MPERSGDTVLVHFYRAVVAHMDVWRLRMDATTNWAAVTLAAMITFSFSTLSAPHYVLLLALVFQFVFLLMESRRYQTFDLWRHRFRMLNRAFIVPALDGMQPEDAGTAELRVLARDLGRTVPHLSLLHAAGYRVRRNYGYLFALTLLAWLLKLEVHPDPAGSAPELIRRAAIAFVPGWLTIGTVSGVSVALLLLAVRAPTHDIVDWETTSSRWQQWLARTPRGGGDVE
ncbi:MAG TPA: DUF2270 domain-containing protein [Longimicrobiales bacterium]